MWGLYECNEDDMDNEFHVIPIDDDEPHTLSRKCECRPFPNAIDEISTIVVHNSFDGREAYEEAMKLLNTSED